jgi:hypothetical protein
MKISRAIMKSMFIYLSINTNRRGFALDFVNYKKVCTRLTAVSDKVYQLLACWRYNISDVKRKLKQ